MKLHWSPKSPFVRKVMIVAHELGLVERITLIRSVAAMTKPNYEIMGDNPLGKLPTLVLEDGSALYDSSVITEYFTALVPGQKLLPSGPERWEVLRRQALGDGINDALVLWNNERNRPEANQSQRHMECWQERVEWALNELESRPRDGFDLGDAAIGAALSYLDFRFAFFDWRAARPQSAAWHRRFEERPSAVATAIINDQV